jgi:hypothetical protein
MKASSSRNLARVLGLLLILALALPLFPASVAQAAGPDWVPGFDSTATTKGMVKYRHLFNPGKNGFDGYAGACDDSSKPECSVNPVNWDMNPAPYAATNRVTFVYDGVNKFTATIDPDGAAGPFVMVYNALSAPGNLNYLQLDLRGQTVLGVGDEIVSFKNAKLNGNPLADAIGNNTNLSWNLKGIDLTGGFTLEGDMVLTWPVSNTGGDEYNKLVVRVGYVPPPPTSAGLSVSDGTICVGEPTTINVNMAGVNNLYGYELKVNYPTAGFTAAGAFVNTWFDTANNANIPPGWNATDSGGVIQFAASKVEPGLPVNGSGTVAQVTLTATTAGVYDITLSNVLLGDRDGNKIAAALSPDKVTVEVCGLATISGKVILQGRGAPPAGTDPLTSGTVTLADAGYGPYSATFDATGLFTINNVKVAPGGTDYTVTAAHGLYLSNQRIQNLAVGANVILPDTKLKGGDADNNGEIKIADLACIGGSFGAAPAVCGATGSSDINADGLVNILDLVLPGGNYDLSSPQSW